MPFRPVLNCVQLLLQGRVNNNLAENTFYFRYQAGLSPLPAELVELANDFVTQTAQYWTAMYTPDVRFDQITVTDLHRADGYQAVVPLIPPIQGGDTGSISVGNQASGLRRRTGMRGKSKRGRIMLMPFPEQHVNRDIIDQAWATWMAQLAAALLIPYPRQSGGVFRPAVASFKLGFSEAITAWAFDTLTDSMSTRLTGHGE